MRIVFSVQQSLIFLFKLFKIILEVVKYAVWYDVLINNLVFIEASDLALIITQMVWMGLAEFVFLALKTALIWPVKKKKNKIPDMLLSTHTL